MSYDQLHSLCIAQSNPPGCASDSIYENVQKGNVHHSKKNPKTLKYPQNENSAEYE